MTKQFYTKTKSKERYLQIEEKNQNEIRKDIQNRFASHFRKYNAGGK